MMNPSIIIRKFDQFLSEKGVSFEGFAIGAGALHILGVIQRQTVDIDVITPDIPQRIQELAEEFRLQMNSKGMEIIPGWFNNGPKQILDALESDWKKRSVKIFEGKSIILHTLGRIDLIATKLVAFCDRQEQDEEDLLQMKPNQHELISALPWAQNYDANPDWAKHVESKAKQLARKLGYEL